MDVLDREGKMHNPEKKDLQETVAYRVHVAKQDSKETEHHPVKRDHQVYVVPRVPLDPREYGVPPVKKEHVVPEEHTGIRDPSGRPEKKE